MWALQFFVYALIIWLLVLSLCGSLIGYYFDKKLNFEVKKISILAESIRKKSEENSGVFEGNLGDNFRGCSQTEIDEKLSKKSSEIK